MADLARQRGSKRAVIDELIVELLCNSGMRVSELCNLTMGDLPVKHGKGCIWIRDGKGGVQRTIDISDRLQKRLCRFIKLYCKKTKDTSFLLMNERGNRMNYISIYSKVKRIGEQAGIGKLHPHMLRHTYLTRLYNVEHDLRFVQDQAGHASPTTTAIYAKTDNESRRRQVEALE